MPANGWNENQRASLRSICVAAWALVWSAQSLGGEWLATPTASASLEHNDNPRLLPAGGAATDGFVAMANLELAAETETTRTTVRPMVTSYRYNNDATLDRDDQFIHASTSTQTELTSWSANVDLARESTLTAERDSTGIVQVNKRKKTFAIAPHWERELSDSYAIYADVGADYIRYDDGSVVGLFDYDSWNAAAGLMGDYSEWLSWQLGGYTSTQSVPDTEETTRSVGWKASLTTQLRDDASATLSAGSRHTVSEYRFFGNDEQMSDNGWLAGVSVLRSFESTNLSASLQRSVDPSGAGALQQRDQLLLQTHYEISESTAWRATFEWSKFQLLKAASESNERALQELTLGMNWQGEVVRWDLSYALQRQSLAGGELWARADVITLAVSWSDRWPLGRSVH